MLVKEAGPGAFRTPNTASASASLTSAILARSAGSSGRSAPQSRQSVCSGPSTSASPERGGSAPRTWRCPRRARSACARPGPASRSRRARPRPPSSANDTGSRGSGKGAVAGTPPGRSGRFGGTPRVSPRAPPSCTSDSLLDRSWSEILSEVPFDFQGAAYCQGPDLCNWLWRSRLHRPQVRRVHQANASRQILSWRAAASWNDVVLW